MSAPDAIALYGAGQMAQAYLDALAHLKWPSDRIYVVSRRPDAAANLAERYGVKTETLGAVVKATSAIISVTPDATPAVTDQACTAGARRLLVEKPGALSAGDLESLAERTGARGAIAHLAYNRRYYPSVLRCAELIAEDGGALACYFEMTEIESRVLSTRDEMGWTAENLSRWGLVNPVHVLDLVGCLVGRPASLDSRVAGRLDWHGAGATFSGSGVSERGAALVYLGTWSSAGRWRIEITTPRRRLILCPLESLQQQLAGSFAVEPVAIAEDPAGTKPGVAAMVSDFLGSTGTTRLPSLREGTEILRGAERIFGYLGRS